LKSSRTNLNIKMHQIVVNGIPIDVVRKAIKNLHLAVYPPEGRVRIATPLNVDDEAVKLFAISKMSWIKNNQAKYRNQQRQPERKYISGESHYFNGQRYILNVVHHTGNPKVSIRNKKYIELLVKSDYTQEQRENVLTNWYRKSLKEKIPALVEKWQKIVGVEVAEWEVKKMKTKWGTCNRTAKRIWLNLDLVKKPVEVIEYILVHELVHLLERYHNKRFYGFLSQFLPDWKILKEELNKYN